MKMNATKNLYVCRNQGIGGNGQAFGFVGRKGEEDVCGVFFDYPRANSRFGHDEIEGIVGTMTYDETQITSPKIDRGEAEELLRSRLADWAQEDGEAVEPW
jgi:hypothetical protein